MCVQNEGRGGPGNPSSGDSRSRGTSGEGQTPGGGGTKDDDTKLPIGDTSGEMEDAGGGRKTTRGASTSGGGPTFDPSRSRGSSAGAGGAATQNPAGSKSEAGDDEPESEENEASDVERGRSAGA